MEGDNPLCNYQYKPCKKQCATREFKNKKRVKFLKLCEEHRVKAKLSSNIYDKKHAKKAHHNQENCSLQVVQKTRKRILNVCNEDINNCRMQITALLEEINKYISMRTIPQQNYNKRLNIDGQTAPSEADLRPLRSHLKKMSESDNEEVYTLFRNFNNQFNFVLRELANLSNLADGNFDICYKVRIDINKLERCTIDNLEGHYRDLQTDLIKFYYGYISQVSRRYGLSEEAVIQVQQAQTVPHLLSSCTQIIPNIYYCEQIYNSIAVNNQNLSDMSMQLADQRNENDDVNCRPNDLNSSSLEMESDNQQCLLDEEVPGDIKIDHDVMSWWGDWANLDHSNDLDFNTQ